MALKTFRPLTPAARFKALPDFAEVTKSKPEKKLTEAIKRTGGRNNQGRITMRHIGGGHKRRLSQGGAHATSIATCGTR